MRPEQYLLLIGELHGCSQHLITIDEPDDREVINEMIVKYNKLYFKSVKEYEQKSKCH
jgi:hypothetical protein